MEAPGIVAAVSGREVVDAVIVEVVDGNAVGGVKASSHCDDGSEGSVAISSKVSGESATDDDDIEVTIAIHVCHFDISSIEAGGGCWSDEGAIAVTEIEADES